MVWSFFKLHSIICYSLIHLRIKYGEQGAFDSKGAPLVGVTPNPVDRPALRGGCAALAAAIFVTQPGYDQARSGSRAGLPSVMFNKRSTLDLAVKSSFIRSRTDRYSA
jgi:hypothetical protein